MPPELQTDQAGGLLECTAQPLTLHAQEHSFAALPREWRVVKALAKAVTALTQLAVA